MPFWTVGLDERPNPSRLANPSSIAVLVFSLVGFIGILIITWNRKRVGYYIADDGDQKRHAFRWLRCSEVLLVFYYLLKIVLLILYEFGIGPNVEDMILFFFYTFTYSVFEVFSDYLLLLIVCRMAYYLFPIFGARKSSDEARQDLFEWPSFHRTVLRLVSIWGVDGFLWYSHQSGSKHDLEKCVFGKYSTFYGLHRIILHCISRTPGVYISHPGDSDSGWNNAAGDSILGRLGTSPHSVHDKFDSRGSFASL